MSTRRVSHGDRLGIGFLGAGKRLSLMERFLSAADREGVRLDLVSIEAHELQPVASVAKVVLGPRFASDEFEPHLLDTVRTYGLDMLIPNMDAATVALSACAQSVRSAGCTPVVSDHTLCRIMEDKVLADEWFRSRGLPVPMGAGWPRIAKHRRGYGSRDQLICQSAAELDWFLAARRASDYFVQPMVRGKEYTVDAYVASDGRIAGVFSRQRLEVSSGEVEISRAERHEGVLSLARRVLGEPGWRGPITIQCIVPGGDSGDPVMIEVNPRFGGGVTHAVQCGVDMPAWLIREQLGRPIELFDSWVGGSIMTRCRRDIFL